VPALAPRRAWGQGREGVGSLGAAQWRVGVGAALHHRCWAAGVAALPRHRLLQMPRGAGRAGRRMAGRPAPPRGTTWVARPIALRTRCNGSG
jgi:hypothetical protein